MYKTINKKILTPYLILGIFIYDIFLKIFVYYYFSYFEININKNAITIVSFVLLLIIAINETIKNKKEYKNYLIFLFFIVYMLTYAVYNLFFGKDYINTHVIIFQLKLIMYSFFYIILAILFYKSMDNNILKKLVICSFFVLLFFIYFHINFEKLRFSLPYIKGEHHLIGESFVLLGLLYLSFINNKHIKFILMTILLVSLYLIKSRAIFYSFFIVYLIFIVRLLGVRNAFYLALSFIVTVIISLYFDLINIDRRMFGINQILSDSSFNERVEQFKYGISAIKNNWVWGEFAGQIVKHKVGYQSGMMGAYMHNFLSFWRQYGFIFFILFSFSYFYLLLKITLLWLKNSENRKLEFVYYLGLYYTILLLFFQGYNQPHVWFSMVLMYICIKDIIHNKVESFR